MNKAAPRRSTNISLNPALVAEARELDVNVSRACETGLVLELKRARAERWKRENAAAIESWNAWTRENELPLEKYRLF
jgi:antitoxin CcdA